MDMNQSGDYRTEYTLETFSFLPPLTQEEVYDQSHYWGMWKLPFFGMQNPDQVMQEIDSCRRAYPDHLIRVIGYDNYTQCQGHNFVVYRPRGM